MDLPTLFWRGQHMNMHVSLRETGEGSLAATPKGEEIKSHISSENVKNN